MRENASLMISGQNLADIVVLPGIRWKKFKLTFHDADEELLRYEKIVNLGCPTNETVLVLRDWLDDSDAIADDGRTYLNDEELRGTWTRERFQIQKGATRTSDFGS
jgi:hypothetical protein